MTMNLVDRVRAVADLWLRRALTPLVQLCTALRITPNQVTVAGFLLTAVSAAVLMAGYPVAAGVVFLLASSLDLVDGLLARLNAQATAFGAFLDSTLDRVSEGAVFMAIAYRFAQQGDAWAVAGVVLALLGGVLTSYTRARAEALGVSCKVGWITRPERVIVIAAGLLFDVLALAVYLLAALTLWTSAQRVLHVYKSFSIQETGGRV
ncbi:MAG: CDP-alcohol phosphatidyltransferase family protein [Pseudomonadota bacterium]|nr:CDP-alcohol phosphatidyltransferase family protein [Pseudomonadota bacterium]